MSAAAPIMSQLRLHPVAQTLDQQDPTSFSARKPETRAGFRPAVHSAEFWSAPQHMTAMQVHNRALLDDLVDAPGLDDEDEDPYNSRQILSPRTIDAQYPRPRLTSSVPPASVADSDASRLGGAVRVRDARAPRANSAAAQAREPGTALSVLVQQEEERLDRLIRHSARGVRARHQRDVLFRRAADRRRASLQEHRETELRQAGRAIVERELTAQERRARNEQRQREADARLQHILEQESLDRVAAFEDDALRKLRQRARAEASRQDKSANDSLLRKVKHEVAINNVATQERARRFAVEQKLREEQQRLGSFLDARSDLRNRFLEEKYRLARVEAGLPEETSAGGAVSPPKPAPSRRRTSSPARRVSAVGEGAGPYFEDELSQAEGSVREHAAHEQSQQQEWQPQQLAPGHQQAPWQQQQQQQHQLYGTVQHTQWAPPPQFAMQWAPQQQQYQPYAREPEPEMQLPLSPTPPPQQQYRAVRPAPRPQQHQQAQQQQPPQFQPPVQHPTQHQQKQVEESEQPQAGPAWFYLDSEGAVQGPFTEQRMRTWHERGLFPLDLLIQADGADPDGFAPLQNVFPESAHAFQHL